MSTTIAPCIGIDVAKATLEIGIDMTGEIYSVANDPQALPALVARLETLAPERIVVEATGGYETLRLHRRKLADRGRQPAPSA